ncbi:MAG: hypothetical protein R2795_27050 [Saprospiraceae bacterium]
MNRKTLWHTFFLMVLIVGLGSCVSDPKTNSSDTEATEDISGIAFKHTDNTVSIRLAAEPDRVSPFLTTSGYARPIYEQIFIPLLEYDPETFELRPALAKARPAVAEVSEIPMQVGWLIRLNFLKMLLSAMVIP